MLSSFSLPTYLPQVIALALFYGGIYQLLLFFTRGRRLASLAATALCFIMGLRTLLQYQASPQAWINVPLELGVRLENALIFLSTPMLLLYLRHSLLPAMPRLVPLTAIVLGLIAACLALVAPLNLVTGIRWPYQYVLLASLVYATVGLARLALGGSTQSPAVRIVLLGVIAITLAAFNDVLLSRGVVLSTWPLVPWGSLLFVIALIASEQLQTRNLLGTKFKGIGNQTFGIRVFASVTGTQLVIPYLLAYPNLAPIYELFSLAFLLWPYVAFELYRYSGADAKAEFRNVTIDAFVFGCLPPLLEFNLWATLVVLVLATSNLLAIGGMRLLLRGSAALFAGIGLMSIVTGFRFNPLQARGLDVLALIYITFYLVYISIVSNRVASKYKFAKKEVKARNAELEAANHTILLKTEELNSLIEELTVTNERLNEANKEIEEQHTSITDSIVYAQRIQQALLPNLATLRSHLPQSFLLYRPRDVLSGDFWWFSTTQDGLLLAVVDCTGHGVPGAFMSVLGHSLLNQVVVEQGCHQPKEILEAMHAGVQRSLKQEEGSTSTALDGMDIALVHILPQERRLQVAAANNAVYMVQAGELLELKPDKQSIGGRQYKETPFTQQELSYQPGDSLYLFTDGFADQFGGGHNRKFSYKLFQKTLLALQGPMATRMDNLASELDGWRGSYEQTDDVLVLGLQL